MNECDICKSSFEKKWQLRTHKSSMHGGCLRCELCERKFYKQHTLREHMRKIHEVDYFEAPNETSAQIEQREMALAAEHHRRQIEGHRQDLITAVELECEKIVALERKLKHRGRLTDAEAEMYENMLRELKKDSDDEMEMTSTAANDTYTLEEIERINKGEF